jgi:microcystin-dependent protein
MNLNIFLVIIIFLINFYILFGLVPTKYNEIETKIEQKKNQIESTEIIKTNKCCPNLINNNLINTRIKSNLLQELDLNSELQEMLEEQPDILEINQSLNYIDEQQLNFKKNIIFNEKLYGNNNCETQEDCGVNVGGNLIINENLNISKNINNQKFNFELSQNFPIGKIILWNSTEIPHGWALCDGKRYKIGTGPAEECDDKCDDSNSITTPNLTDKFLLGKSEDSKIGEEGGRDKIQLTLEDIPKHPHKYDKAIITSQDMIDDEDDDIGLGYDNTLTKETYDNKDPLQILPKHIRLIYIFKICY